MVRGSGGRVGLLAAVAALTTAISCAAQVGPQEPPTSPTECRDATAAVAMRPGGPADQQIAGTLCVPDSAATVQLLLHGGVHDRWYWTARGDRTGPSYVEAMTAAGQATLAIDRLGAGASSHPPSSAYAADTQEFVAHQLVQQLRDGRLAGRPFERVIAVGHSLGSTIARMLALTYPGDVDGLVLTGESSTPNWAVQESLDSEFRPANTDPRLADRHLDDGYVTLAPGRRAELLYHHPSADPAVVAEDEANPEPYVFVYAPGWGDTARNVEIAVPVLYVIGDRDPLLCGAGATECSDPGALQAQQAAWYRPGARLQTILVADTGHLLTLHRTAPGWYPQVARWAQESLG
jgi:pimeloyl-ACP methyl ester carboxylesterase